jgi:23S rRNA (adenine2503-C2)-methyltransferase
LKTVIPAGQNLSGTRSAPLLGMDLPELLAIVRRLGEPEYRARQLFEGIYRQRISSLDQITTLPALLRRKAAEQGIAIGPAVVDKTFTSVDGTIRYLISFADGESVETVWMPEGDGAEDDVVDPDPSVVPARKPFRRATICISSQVGCAVNCQFCMTALLGLKRNLTAGEIVGQVIAVLNERSVNMEQDRMNLVFMGQGEPFHNYDNFIKAVRLLVEGVGFAESRMTVSTSGIVPRIADLGREALRPRLAISLNASNDEARTKLIPINKKWDIASLVQAAREFPLRNREKITFEYVLLDHVNDLPENAREVIEIVRGLRAKVNLIAWNSGPEIPFQTPSDDRVLAFQRILIDAGVPTFIRRPRGRDIYAACGQLKKTVA